MPILHIFIFFELFPQADSHAGEVGVLTEDGDPIVALSSAVAGIDSKLRAREVWRLLVLGKPRHAHNNHQERSWTISLCNDDDDVYFFIMSINVNGFQIHSDQVQGEFKWFRAQAGNNILDLFRSRRASRQSSLAWPHGVSSNKNGPNPSVETRHYLELSPVSPIMVWL